MAHKHKYPFADLEVGESFNVNGETTTHNRLCALSWYYKKKLGHTFTVRKEGQAFKITREV